MKKMNVYILEDETNILKYIISLVQNIPYLQIVGYTGELSTAKNEIPTLKPDIVLADIHLNDGVSFTLFQNIDLNFHLIFITSYDHFAIQALNIGAFAYILKPIEIQAFNDTIEKCYSKSESFLNNKNQLLLTQNQFVTKKEIDKIALRTFDFIQIVNVSDILFCQSDKGYTTFFINDGTKIIVSKVLKEYEDILPESLFIRCHQSFLVNINYIAKYFKDGQIELVSKHTIPVSERKREVVIAFINKIS